MSWSRSESQDIDWKVEPLEHNQWVIGRDRTSKSGVYCEGIHGWLNKNWQFLCRPQLAALRLEKFMSFERSGCVEFP